MKVGIVIPTHSEEKNIGIALEELRNSLRDLYNDDIVDDYVVVVVDDSSEDKTAEEATKQGAKVIRFDKRVGKGTAVITGIKEVLKYGVDCVVVNDADEQSMRYVPKFIKALKKADAAFAYSPKKTIFSRFMNAITGRDYTWGAGLKAFRKELAEELVKPESQYYVKLNYDVYSTLLPYIKGKKVKKIEVEGDRKYAESKFESRKIIEYILTLPIILKAVSPGYVGITFNFDEWYERNKELPPEEIIKKIERAEKTSQALIGAGLFISTVLGCCFYKFPDYEKLMYFTKGYLASFLTSSGYRTIAKNKKLGKFIGLLVAIIGDVAREVKDYYTGGVVEVLDVASDSAGASFSSLITYLYERKIEKIFKYKSS